MFLAVDLLLKVSFFSPTPFPRQEKVAKLEFYHDFFLFSASTIPKLLEISLKISKKCLDLET